MLKKVFSIAVLPALLLVACTALPTRASLPSTDCTDSASSILCPAAPEPASFELAAASKKIFTLTDPNSKAKVETYTLQPGWSGFGNVSFNQDISGANMLTWFSGFKHTSGAQAYCDSERVASVPTSFANSGYVKNTSQLANQMAQLIAQRAQVKNVKPTSFKIVSCNDAEINKAAAGFKQMYGAQANVMTREILGEFSFSKGNQSWGAKLRLPLLVSEARMMGNIYSTVVMHVYQEMYIYPLSQKKNCLSSAQAIIKSRQITQEWSNTVNQLRGNVSAGAINNARKQADIWRQTGEDISNMNRDSYQKQNASQDRLSQKRSDATLGNVTTADPFNPGEKITVRDNAKYIWVNEDGKQCGSNDGNYNPNQDPKRNDEEWILIKK